MSNTVQVPVQRRPAAARMDAATEAAWTRWAGAIARAEAQRVVLDTAPAVADAIRAKVDPLEARIDQLEQRVTALEAQLAGGEVIEWPLPTKGRAA